MSRTCWSIVSSLCLCFFFFSFLFPSLLFSSPFCSTGTYPCTLEDTALEVKLHDDCMSMKPMLNVIDDTILKSNSNIEYSINSSQYQYHLLRTIASVYIPCCSSLDSARRKASSGLAWLGKKVASEASFPVGFLLLSFSRCVFLKTSDLFSWFPFSLFNCCSFVFFLLVVHSSFFLFSPFLLC